MSDRVETLLWQDVRGTLINADAKLVEIIDQISPDDTFKIYKFGVNPYAGLIQGSDGNFYGTTDFGGNGNGTVFKITSSGVKTTLYSFGGGTDGEEPHGGLIQASDGNFYGTTHNGGYGGGTVFRISSSGVKTTLYSFSGVSGDGGYPLSGLIQGSDGNFYGTSFEGGGTNGYGTVFKIYQ